MIKKISRQAIAAILEWRGRENEIEEEVGFEGDPTPYDRLCQQEREKKKRIGIYGKESKESAQLAESRENRNQRKK